MKRPCYNCLKRKLGCHSKRKDYLIFKKDMEKKKQKEQEYKNAEIAHYIREARNK